MEIVEWPFGVALREVQFATLERIPLRRHRQIALRFRPGDRWKLGKELEAPDADRFPQIVVADVREENKRRGRAKFLALEKQRRPGSQQQERCHCSVNAG